MTVLLDTNIIMDALQERQPFDVSAKEILLLGQNKKIKCCFTANSATDVFYLCSKARGRKTAKEAIRFLFNTYDVVSITQDDGLKALELPNEDFEDALIEVCAKKVNADYIISRDDEFISIATEVEVMKPDKFLTLL